MDLQPKNLVIQRNLAILYFNTGEKEKAEQNLRKLIEQGFLMATYVLGYILLENRTAYKENAPFELKGRDLIEGFMWMHIAQHFCQKGPYCNEVWGKPEIIKHYKKFKDVLNAQQVDMAIKKANIWIAQHPNHFKTWKVCRGIKK